MSIAGVVVLALVALAGVLAAHRVAEQEAVTDALRLCDQVARATFEPALTDAVIAPSPVRATVPGPPVAPADPTPQASTAWLEAQARLDTVVHTLVLSSNVVRVKLWTPDGRIVYSDEERLIGRRFALDESAQRAFETRTTVGELSDLTGAENIYEQANGSLLEVYRPVHTPSGQPLLFEVYTRYGPISAHSGQMWAKIALIIVGSLLLMHVLWVPLSWVLVNRLRHARRQRDLFLDRAMSASDEERRRIAGTLHDGVVQELAATSFVVAGSAQEAERANQTQLAERLETAAAGVRASIGALRSLLVDIYPPNLGVAGLSATLSDLATALHTRGMRVLVAEDADLDLDPGTQTLIYRVAQECLRNADRHAQATHANVRISRREDHIRLEVTDNGVGFDPERTLGAPNEGHFGLRVMCDLVNEAGARMAVRTAPGAGTHWLLEVRPHAQ